MINVTNARFQHVDRAALAWELIPIALSFYQANGHFDILDGFDLSLSLFDCSQDGIKKIVPNEQVFYFYSYVVHVYEYLPASVTYVGVASGAIELIEEGEIPNVVLVSSEKRAPLLYS